MAVDAGPAAGVQDAHPHPVTRGRPRLDHLAVGHRVDRCAEPAGDIHPAVRGSPACAVRGGQDAGTGTHERIPSTRAIDDPSSPASRRPVPRPMSRAFVRLRTSSMSFRSALAGAASGTAGADTARLVRGAADRRGRRAGDHRALRQRGDVAIDRRRERPTSDWPAAASAPAATAATVARPRSAAGGGGIRCAPRPACATAYAVGVLPGAGPAPLGERWRAKTCLPYESSHPALG